MTNVVTELKLACVNRVDNTEAAAAGLEALAKRLRDRRDRCQPVHVLVVMTTRHGDGEELFIEHAGAATNLIETLGLLEAAKLTAWESDD